MVVFNLISKKYIDMTVSKHINISKNNNYEEPKKDFDNNGSKSRRKSFPTPKSIGTDYSYKHIWVWKNIIGFLILHTLAIAGLVILLTGGVNLKTYMWVTLLALVFTEAITIGAHRLYAHRSFKATPVFRAIIMLLQAGAGQNSMFIWCRDHRLHHRYSDTDADPHNSKRGFFFCHMGWLMKKKHPLVTELGRKIDMSDLEADWMVIYQKKYYYYLYFLFGVFIPVFVPVYFFGEPLLQAFLVCYTFRTAFQLNGTWLVNSVAHLYGTRPYDKNLQPVESNFVSFISFGEGWHNYHHAFPWDYKAAELSTLYNQTAQFIKLCERIGLTYDLKTASPEMIRHRVIRTGDGTHYQLGNDEDRMSVTAIGPMHPLNPSYNAKYKAPDPVLELEGLPLFHEKDLLDSDHREKHIGQN